MFNVLLIDDEKYALEFLSQELKNFNTVKILAMFQDARKALVYLETNKIDLIFVDINMPQFTGIDFLKIVKQNYSDIHIILTTAHDHHTLEAFRHGAYDYIMKPVLKDRIAETLNRIQKNSHSLIASKMIIKTFGEFSITFNNEVLKWRTSKAKEIVCYLLIHKGTKMHQGKMIQDIWHDSLEDVSKNYMYSIVYYARQTFKKIGFPDIIEYANNYYNLNTSNNNSESDLDMFNQFCSTVPFFTFNSKNIGEAMNIAELYTNDIYQLEDYHWCIDYRATLSKQYESLLYHIANYYYNENLLDQAYVYIKKLTDHNTFNDNAHHLMLSVYKKTGDEHGFNLYQEKIDALYFKELGITLSKDTNND